MKLAGAVSKHAEGAEGERENFRERVSLQNEGPTLSSGYSPYASRLVGIRPVVREDREYSWVGTGKAPHKH